MRRIRGPERGKSAGAGDCTDCAPTARMTPPLLDDLEESASSSSSSSAGLRSYGLRSGHLDLGRREREGCTPLRSGPRGADPDLLTPRWVRCGFAREVHPSRPRRARSAFAPLRDTASAQPERCQRAARQGLVSVELRWQRWNHRGIAVSGRDNKGRANVIRHHDHHCGLP